MGESRSHQPIFDFNSPANMVTLISKDGCSFVIHKGTAARSKLLSTILDNKAAFVENQTLEVHFDNINGSTLQKVVEFMYFKDQSSKNSKINFSIDDQMILDVLVAADFFQL